MGWMLHFLNAVGENGNDSGITCRWLLMGGMGPMAGAIVFLILWVKSLIADIKALNAERMTDLKDNFRSVKKPD